MPGNFDKWWKCLKKHKKRSKHWLPIARELRERNGRPIRYFTLCARTMIDVFMFAKENILDHDESFRSISDVVFCEYEPQDHAEIQSMLGIPGSGFPHRLEDLMLFKDDAYTSGFQDLRKILEELEDQGLSATNRRRLMLKQGQIEFGEKFPFDFLNLDFCEYYYDPPKILAINDTVERIFKLQLGDGKDGNGNRISIDQFVLSVTCKFDQNIPQKAFTRLEELVRQNQKDHLTYRQAIQASRPTADPKRWRASDGYDFFLSAWPKDLMRAAAANGWQVRVAGFLQYDRVSDSGNPYKMVCLVAELVRKGGRQSYLTECLRILDPANRIHIPKIPRRSVQGRQLLSNLRAIVKVRNQRARSVGRQELPNP